MLIKFDLALTFLTLGIDRGIIIVESRKGHVVLGIFCLVVFKGDPHTVDSIATGTHKKICSAHEKHLVLQGLNKVIHVASKAGNCGSTGTIFL